MACCYWAETSGQSFNRRYDLLLQGVSQTAWSVETDGVGGYVIYIAGAFQDSLYYSSVIGAIRLDALGNVVSTSHNTLPGKVAYPGLSNTSCRTSSGHHVIGGNTFTNPDSLRAALFKFNELGEPDTVFEFLLPTLETVGRQAKATPDGGFVVCGETTLGDYLDAFIIKADSAGNVEWYQTYGGIIVRDIANSLALSSDGGYFMGGSKEVAFDSFDQWVVRVDSTGDVVWEDTYGIPNNDDVAGAGIEALADGNLVFASSWNISETLGYHPCLVKLDGAGNVIWSDTYGGPAGLAALYVVKEISPNGDLIASGQYEPLGDGQQGCLLRTSSAGDSLWMRLYFYADSLMSDGEGALRDVLPTTDGGFIAVGRVNWSHSGNDPPGYNPDVWVVKVDSMGCLEPGCHLITGLQSQATNLRGALTAAPNPAGEVAYVKWELPAAMVGSARLSVVSAAGQLVSSVALVLADKGQKLDVSNYPAGLYHLHLVVDGKWVSGARLVVE